MANLGSFLADLKVGQVNRLPELETWLEMIQRIHVPGRINQIKEEAYDYFLGVLPPRWQGDCHFAFAEGAETVCIFWFAGPPDDRNFYCRQLTTEEHKEFCRLAKRLLPPE